MDMADPIPDFKNDNIKMLIAQAFPDWVLSPKHEYWVLSPKPEYWGLDYLLPAGEIPKFPDHRLKVSVKSDVEAKSIGRDITDEKYWALENLKITFRAVEWPKSIGKDGTRNTGKTHKPLELPTATVSGSKSPETISREIEKKVLVRYRELYLHEAKQAAIQIKSIEARYAVLKQFAKIGGEEFPSAWHKNNSDLGYEATHLGLHGKGIEVVDVGWDGSTAKVTLERMDTALAVEVAEMVVFLVKEYESMKAAIAEVKARATG
jgi:hypothetical protein